MRATSRAVAETAVRTAAGAGRASPAALTTVRAVGTTSTHEESKTVSSKPILVTGANGFVASHSVRQLLEKGYHVRGTVRNTEDKAKLAHLTSLPGADTRLELVPADLDDASSMENAVKGCEYVLHIAAPFADNVSDPQTELVDPAVRANLAVMEAASKASGVKRVVVTSTMATVTDEPEEGKVLTEADWNTKSSLDRNPYFYARTLAERAAWDHMAHAERGFDLVTIQLPFIIGPSLSPKLNVSNGMVAGLLSGGFPVFIDITWGFTDVRDAARAHILAMETSAASGRYIVANERATIRELAGILAELGFDKYKLPSVGLDNMFGTAFLKLVTYFQSNTMANYLHTHIGRHMEYDHSKARRDLGLEFTPLRSTLTELVPDLIKWGHLDEVAEA